MIYKYLYSIFVLFLFTGCANVIPPSGGPEDLIPPQVMKITPDKEHNTNFSGNAIIFEFSEPIEINSFKKNTIITPDPGTVDYSINKKKLIIKFKDDLKPNTTYRIVLDKTVRDITKRNEMGNVQYAFSTGSHIDSLSINGQVKLLLTNGIVANALIGLYEYSDTLNISKEKPYYYAYTNALGFFNINYLKQGKYEMYAFLDKNNNFKWETSKELIGYLSHPLELNNSKDSLQFLITAHDTTSTRYVYDKEEGNGNLIHFNKGIKSIELEPEVKYTISESGTDVMLYTTFTADSSYYSFNYSDSSGIQQSKSLYLKKRGEIQNVKFREKISVNNQTKQPSDTLSITFAFNEPIEKVIEDSIKIQLDTTYIPWNSFNIDYNNSKTIVSLTSKEDLTFDTVRVYLKDSAFVSIYGNKSRPYASSKIMKGLDEYGIIKGSIVTIEKSYIIELLDKTFNKVKELYTPEVSSFEFKDLDPGEYNIRVLIDTNGNGKYDMGDITQKTQPEPIYIFPDAIMIRKNWEIMDINLQF